MAPDPKPPERDYREILTEIGNLQEDMPNLRWSRYHHACYTGDVVPGCRVCMRRALHCVHIGLRCNLDCGFCPHPPEAREGNHKADAAICERDLSLLEERVVRGETIMGVSFSGGEPLLWPERLRASIARVRALLPEAHLWLYTNGLLADEALWREVHAWGIEEVRLNLAGCDYGEAGLRALAAARAVFAYTLVEVPAFPEQRQVLMDVLPRLEEIGIDQLILQELVITPGNLATMPGQTYDLAGVRLLAGSRRLAYDVMRRCLREGYGFTVVECSAGVKHLLDQGSPLGY